MCRKLAILVSLMMLSLIATIPEVLCAQPPPSPWLPREEEWCPMSPEEARPEIGLRIVIYGGVYGLLAGEPFYLWYRWGFLPTNVVYRESTGEPVTAYMNLQDRTDSANCRYAVTINSMPLEPTDSFTGTCKWYHFWNNDYWAVAPRAVFDEYYIEFPNGLPQGTYEVELFGQPTRGEPFSYITILNVAAIG